MLRPVGFRTAHKLSVGDYSKTIFYGMALDTGGSIDYDTSCFIRTVYLDNKREYMSKYDDYKWNWNRSKQKRFILQSLVYSLEFQLGKPLSTEEISL